MALVAPSFSKQTAHPQLPAKKSACIRPPATAGVVEAGLPQLPGSALAASGALLALLARVPAGKRRSRSNLVRLRAGTSGALTETLNVTEVYRLLKKAPTQQHALQLAARLRKAAREGKRTKDGRSLDAQVVDEALDVLLENNARLKTPVATPRTPSYYDDEDDEEETLNPFARVRQEEAPWAEEAFPGADGRDELVQAMAEEAAQDQAEEEGFRGRGYRGTSAEEDEDGMGDYAEDMEKQREEPPKASPKAPPRWKSGTAPSESEAGRDVDRVDDGDDGDVPYELWEQVISPKFNVVDRVWKAPTSSDLPKVPKLSEDAMVPESAWLRMPHIAVNGMTNCGKSSLINHIVRWTYAAKASSRAGRTTSIDFYVVNNRFVLVDLPGYPDPEEMAHQGVLKRWEAAWEDLVLRYLKMCEEGVYDLRLMMHLQQSHKRPSRACRRFVEELQQRKLPMLLILTKDDHLVKPNDQRNAYATQIKKTLRMEGPHIHYTSKGSLEMGRRSKKHVQKWIRTAVTAESSDQVKQLLKEKWENRSISAIKRTPEELQAKKEFWKARYRKLRQEKKAQRKKERAAMARAERERKASGESQELELEDEATPSFL